MTTTQRKSACGLTECRGKHMCPRCEEWADMDAMKHLLPPGVTWQSPLTPKMVRQLLGAERKRWESAIGAVMPSDFKAWRDSPAERPQTAAWCIQNARSHADLAWLQVAAERERCARLVEQMTYKDRWISAGINSEPIKDCRLAAAIRDCRTTEAPSAAATTRDPA